MQLAAQHLEQGQIDINLLISDVQLTRLIELDKQHYLLQAY